MHMHYKRAFTLIELLVVVLIIGILAAVAVPQYQKAVERSRATQAFVGLSTLYQAAESYLLANGEWPSSVNDLEIDFSSFTNSGWKAFLEKNDQIEGVLIRRITGPYTGTGLSKYKKHPYNTIPKEQILCVEQKSNALYLYTGESGSYCTKILNGKPVYNPPGAWSEVYKLP